MPAFLRLGHDYLEESKEFASVRAAIDAFRIVAVELFSYGQSIDATIHMAVDKADLDEYPDYVLTYDGRVHKEIA